MVPSMHHFNPPVDDAVGVQVVQRADQLLGNVLHHILGQVLIILKDLEQLALGKL